MIDTLSLLRLHGRLPVRLLYRSMFVDDDEDAKCACHAMTGRCTKLLSSLDVSIRSSNGCTSSKAVQVH